MFRILESFLLLVFGIGILCEQYTKYRNKVSKKNLFLFITAIILMICVVIVVLMTKNWLC